ncbi:hypothetical protein [uncultured Proteiniphilum sp.]|nr:hypothetical protein [uncultured Proteiniphilum sp.]
MFKNISQIDPVTFSGNSYYDFPDGLSGESMLDFPIGLLPPKATCSM